MTPKRFRIQYSLRKQELGRGDLYDVLDQFGEPYGDPAPKHEAIASRNLLQALEDQRVLSDANKHEDYAIANMIAGPFC